MIEEMDSWLIRAWDDGVVVFDLASGDTHLAPSANTQDATRSEVQ